MNFRARLSLFALEARETPSTVPIADPYTDPSAPPSTDPATTAPATTAPATIDPTLYTAEGAVTAGATTDPGYDPLTATNSLTKTPVVP